jgi:hypothetical protein
MIVHEYAKQTLYFIGNVQYSRDNITIDLLLRFLL